MLKINWGITAVDQDRITAGGVNNKRGTSYKIDRNPGAGLKE